MPQSGALQLKDYPTALVRLACTRCERKGQYRKTTLIKQHGAETTLPDLRARIAKCEREGQRGQGCRLRHENSPAHASA